MKFISLFAGIGGFDLALENLGHECVYANDFNKYAAQIYDKNFSKGQSPSPRINNGGNESGINNSDGNGRRADTSNLGGRIDQRDITQVQTSEIPDHDLLCGGFPCQSFSIAGNRRGFDDTRGTMFFEIARILRDKKPRYLILENVKGLLSHDGGRTFKTIITTLVELGYDLQWQVLNSKNFGVPQNRERVFIIGHLRGGSRPEIFPIGYNRSKTPKLSGHEDIQIANTLTARYEPAQATGTYIGESTNESKRNAQIHQLIGGSQGYRVYDPDGLSTTLASQAGGMGAKTGLYAVKMERSDEAKRIRREMMAKGRDWSPRQGKQLGLRDDDLMNTITSNWEVNQAVTDGIKIRRLTPLECERLQGFPDGWTEFGLVNGEVIKMSDTQRYKTLGNAVSVPVVAEVAKGLICT